LIKIKSKKEIDLLRTSGRVLADIFEVLKGSLKSGMTTRDIDALAENMIAEHHAISAFKGYRGYPSCVCVSINEEVVHGIPGERVIRDGDLVSLDIGLVLEGYYSDMAMTIPVGTIDRQKQKLIDVTKESLRRGIAQAVAGHHLFDISYAIQSYVEANDFSVVRDFVGHGIGTSLHEDPEIPNFGRAHTGPVLKTGMVFAIEPMVNMGTWETVVLENHWTVVTKDCQPSAHFEHTVAITDSGPEILTK